MNRFAMVCWVGPDSGLLCHPTLYSYDRFDRSVTIDSGTFDAGIVLLNWFRKL